MNLDFDKHPCFSSTARHQYGRIHLPVAPRCNIQCKFCNREFDCPNESRPGVTSSVLSPEQALYYLGLVMRKNPNISVVGIAGPGDPFANPVETMETLRLVRESYPDMMLCVATNGLNVTPYVEELAELDVSHVTLTINAVKLEIAREIYSWVRHGKRIRRDMDAAGVLIENQLAALWALKKAGLVVKINTIVIPGINDNHIEYLAAHLASMGADIQNCIPIYPVKGTPFEHLKPLPTADLSALRLRAGTHIKQMRHCARCRADAVGLVGQSNTVEITELLTQSALQTFDTLQDTLNRPYVAVATQEGLLVNKHLGDADELLIYGQSDNGFELVGRRQTPERGIGDKRWQDLTVILNDCRTLLVSGIGSNPTAILSESGIRVTIAEGLIDEALERVFNNKPIPAPVRFQKCGDGCGGDGGGCG